MISTIRHPTYRASGVDVPELPTRRFGCLSEGDAHELWQLPVDLECVATVKYRPVRQRIEQAIEGLGALTDFVI